ncbi:MAG: carboxymuconolactone decarboxylase family protein [Kofleriaceae bacterium]
MTTYQLSLPPQTIDGAAPGPRPHLEQAQRQFGFVPNMYAFMAQQPGLLETYVAGYDAFRADSGFTPPEQEVVLLTISRDNRCGYCVAAHSMVGAQMTGVPAAVLAALRADQPLPDPRLAALSRFTSAMVASRGNPTPVEADAFLAAGFTERHVLAVVLAISVKTISNYANHVFRTPVDAAFAAFTWTPAT